MLIQDLIHILLKEENMIVSFFHKVILTLLVEKQILPYQFNIFVSYERYYLIFTFIVN